MVGVSGGELGIRGFVVALDTETGEEVWRTYTVPGPGEPGNDTWPEGAWRTGGPPYGSRAITIPIWDSRIGARATPAPGSETSARATICTPTR